MLERAHLPTPKTWFFLAVALFATVPAWIVAYPPIMDFPFHLATIRVVHDFHNPAFGFDEHFVLTLGRTQYVLFYVFGSVMSYVVGVRGAMVLLVSFYLGGTVLGMRELLKSLGKDERLALLVVPLLPNVLFMFGLFPFLIGVPLVLFGLAVAIRWFEEPTRLRGISLALLAIALFFSHIFPFAIFGIGFAAMFPWTRPRSWIRAGLPVLPSLGALAWWGLGTEAGRLTFGTLTDSEGDPRLPIDRAIQEVPNWLLNIFADRTDDGVFIAWFVVLIATFALSQGDRDDTKALVRRYAILPLACVYFYFSMPQGHGYIWLISQRFPVLFAILLIPLLRMPAKGRGHLVAIASLVIGAFAIVNTAAHFIRFQDEELGDFDEALARIEPNKRVAALVYDRGSETTAGMFAPFLHFGSYYQAARGGVAMFTYAGYAHWPFDFRDGEYPPPGGSARPRWEWEPERVSVNAEIVPYYDYVLVRGDRFRPGNAPLREVFAGDRWSVWKNESR
jgi:hypothetical protein